MRPGPPPARHELDPCTAVPGARRRGESPQRGPRCSSRGWGSVWGLSCSGRLKWPARLLPHARPLWFLSPKPQFAEDSLAGAPRGPKMGCPGLQVLFMNRSLRLEVLSPQFLNSTEFQEKPRKQENAAGAKQKNQPQGSGRGSKWGAMRDESVLSQSRTPAPPHPIAPFASTLTSPHFVHEPFPWFSPPGSRSNLLVSFWGATGVSPGWRHSAWPEATELAPHQSTSS